MQIVVAVICHLQSNICLHRFFTPAVGNHQVGGRSVERLRVLLQVGQTLLVAIVFVEVKPTQIEHFLTLARVNRLTIITSPGIARSCLVLVSSQHNRVRLRTKSHRLSLQEAVTQIKGQVGIIQEVGVLTTV